MSYGDGDEIAAQRQEIKELRAALEWAAAQPRSCGSCVVFSEPGCCRKDGCKQAFAKRAIEEGKKS